MHRNTETRICKTLISNILCYAGETWIMSKVEITLAATEQKIFNLWITKKGGGGIILLLNWVHTVPIFFKLFSQHFFFKVRLKGSIEVNTLLLFRFLVLHVIIQGVPGGMCQTSGECSLC